MGLPVRMVAVDMDGTLLGGDGRVSERTMRAIGAAETADVEVVVATGRRHCYAMRQLRGLPWRSEGVLVSSNGAVTRTVGSRLLVRRHMGVEAARELCGHMGEFRNALVVTFDRVGEDGEDERGALVVEEGAELHGSIGRWMVANEPYIEHVTPVERALERGEAPIQMMLCGTVERMRRAEARLRELPWVSGVEEASEGCQIALHRTEYPERDLSILDILPAGCSKGVAVAEVALARGIEAAEVMAIGDNWNDLSMLEWAGWPVLMGNAPAELLGAARERGWRVAGRHDADGVAELLEELVAAMAAVGAAGDGARRFAVQAV